MCLTWEAIERNWKRAAAPQDAAAKAEKKETFNGVVCGKLFMKWSVGNYNELVRGKFFIKWSLENIV